MAQTDNLKMSDLREINYQVVKLIGEYETYSTFSGTEDFSGYSNLFVSADASVYCDIPYNNSMDDKIGLREYLNIVKSNSNEVETVVKVNKINLPSFTGKTGSVKVEIAKSVSGLNKCNTDFKDVFNLVVTVSFQSAAGLFDNFKISEINCKTPRGKLIVLMAIGPKGKALTNEPFMINKSTFTSDINGTIKYHFMNKDSSLSITPLNSEYTGIVKYNNYQDLLTHSKKGISPCEPGLVEFSFEKAAALATITKTEKKETKKEKLERENYEKVIADAAVLLTAKKFQEAKALFQSALKTNPNDKYAQQKIHEIDLSLSEIKTHNESYAKAVAEGDAFYNAASYREALEPYQLANSIKPEEKYPLEQIEKINGIFELLKKKDENYASLIIGADKLLAEKKYSEAKASYQSALKSRPDEKYPQQKITEIDIALTGIKVGDENYNKAITEGDNYFNAARYSEASAPYKKASKLKPEEKYPLMQIEKINGILADLKKKDQNYTAEIALAEKLFAENKYNEAIASYNKALAIKPGEKYPKEKISAIKSIQAGTKNVNAQYSLAISDGNANFAAKEYDKALVNYKTAQQLKPKELLPIDKITQTETEIKRLNESYAAAIADGDNKFAIKQYQPALEVYNQALNIKPGEKYPTDKINEINGILELTKVSQEQYDKALSDGNGSFEAKDYEKALSNYEVAMQLKPEEQLPKDQISKTEREIKKVNERYLAFISEGDKLFNSKKYPEAIDAYQKALAIKPAKKYPKDQIALIRASVEKEKASEFSVGIVLNYILPSATGPIVDKTKLIQNKVTSSFSLGYGIVAGYTFELGKLGQFKARTGLTIDNINFKSELDQYFSQNYSTDKDNSQYVRKIKLNNLKEDIKLSYLSIPLGLEKIFTLGKSGWALSLNAGVNFMFLSSAKYESSANIFYVGYYPDLFNLTISDNKEYNFGSFAVKSANDIKAKSSLTSIDFGAGVSRNIGRMSVFAEFRHRSSSENLFETKDLWSLSENFLQLESTMNFKNYYNLRYNYLTLGLVYNL
jgi:tetratricopeptide (TPR) repeat protein